MAGKDRNWILITQVMPFPWKVHDLGHKLLVADAC